MDIVSLRLGKINPKREGRIMVKKTGLLGVLLFLLVTLIPAFATAAAPEAVTVTLCDNFGREWDVTYDSTNATLRGCRDKNNELGCGCMAAYGLLGGGKFNFAVLDTTSDLCLATYWEGSWGMGGGSGNVWNESGYFGTFTLSVCAGAAGTAGDGKDPSLR